CQQYDSDSLSF
nr:immunoglobulin light chain junction region [Macaca mulatta]MOV81196.1 immunoglobulin light chain junction region [Macaca mulatta]MOV82719.1 immunoglobulin light chain junction region [Macaca mulatta]MOV82880.1 immunoglobulin light chain junction region [Macaca mulatta]MOV83677.1 immunoglobulin light chain junction region [Macaca mulatta]